ncbi:MAG TPA: WD40 repeat domain-containing protein [Streptosporangiaceae bacterium]|nr:WD40 repeat domain-containing protein [Streptosporangiaceae bacterium]
MELTNRITRILYVDGAGVLAADVAGRIHLLDDDLNLIRSSPVIDQARPIHGLDATSEWVVGRDRGGTVLRWSLPALDLLDRLDPVTTCDERMLIEDEEPAPVNNRGIRIWRDKVYVTLGYHDQMAVIDLPSFKIDKIVPNISGDSAMEWICTEHPDMHVISDKYGRLFFGSLDTLDFTLAAKLDEGTIHRVRYDRRHDRFWCTQDFGAGDNHNVLNGIVIVRPDGSTETECMFAYDDVEFVVFSPDYTRVYVGGFDGTLHVFDNTERTPRTAKVLSGFTHQLWDCVSTPRGDLVILTQDGIVRRFDPEAEVVRARAPFRRQAVWDIQPSTEDPGTLYCATDDGVAVVKVDYTSAAGPLLRKMAHHVTGFGFTRRVVPVPGGWIGVTRDRKAFRSDQAGRLLWTREFPDLVHTVAVSPDHARALVATNGGAIELAAASGERRAELHVDGLPIWVVGYTPTGERLLGTRNGVFCAFADDGTELWRLNQGEYPKRLRSTETAIYVNGANGFKEIAPDGSRVLRHWTELISNTTEGGVVVDGLVCVCSYGMQLGAFDYASGEMVGLLENLMDYPKALTVLRGPDGTPYLVVGGRTGYLSTYRIDRGPEKGTFAKLRDVWLPKQETVTEW